MRSVHVALAGAFLMLGSAAIAAANDDSAHPMRPGCGYVQENGKYIFLGTCPEAGSDATPIENTTPEPT